MPKEFRLPDLGEGVTDVQVLQVAVSEGEEVDEDQLLLLVETENARIELPSPYTGRVARVHVQPSQRVQVGTVLFTFGEAREGTQARANIVTQKVAKRRQLILAGYAVAVAIACFAYVPWHQQLPGPSRGVSITQNLGYGWVWEQPTNLAHVDIGRVGLELVGLTVIAGALWVLAGTQAGDRGLT